MDFDTFAQINSLGHLAGAVQRDQQNALLREQNELECVTQQQNAKIIRLLEEQKAREDAEKSRLESLPQCPDCKSPIEFGVRRCKHCRTEIVTWDYTGEGLPWRLICRKDEAAHLLEARKDSLLAVARQLQRVCIETCRECDSTWLSRIEKYVEELEAMIGRQKTNMSRTALRECINAYLAGKPMLTPKERAFLDGWHDEIKRTYSDEQKSDLNIRVYKANEAVLHADACSRELGGNFSAYSIGCAILFAVTVGVLACGPFIILRLIVLGLDDAVNYNVRQLVSVQLFVGVSAFVIRGIIYPLICSARLTSARRKALVAEEWRSKFNTRERAALDALNENAKSVNDKNRERLSQCGALALCDAIDAANDSLASRWSNIRNLCGDLRRYYLAAESVESFARSIGVDLVFKATTIEFNCCNCGSTVRVAKKATGKNDRCPNCDERVRVTEVLRGHLIHAKLVEEMDSAAARAATVLHGTELDGRMTFIADGVNEMQRLLASLKKIDI